MTQKLIYVASPYTHPDETIRKLRVDRVREFVADIFRAGEHHAFSPVLYSHQLTEVPGRSIPGAFSFWRDFCERTLSACDDLWVYCLPGVEESVGVALEVDYARALGMECRAVVLLPSPDVRAPLRWCGESAYLDRLAARGRKLRMDEK